MKKFLIIVLLFNAAVFGQSFGQNKVQYRDFDWQYIEAPHFDIYYYGDEKPLAEFTAEVIEDAYDQVSKHLRWELNKRVTVIVYHSHNDFQQTNVVWDYMSEGIGGVTELFKNRVVIPFEGSYEQFRHVIHHELVHAVVNDMIYGGNIQSIISGRVRLNIPLWANEGLAEYLSSNWDTQADMILRDISINERMPSINELNYYFAYKGGQSVWRFIAEKYGREKVGEIFIAMKRRQDAEKGFRKALGLDFEELTEQWHKYLKKEYWSDISGRDELTDVSKRITDHKEDRNFYNVSPAVSPDGSKIAILTDRSGYADIMLIDGISGKRIKTLVKGNRSVDFEELKWLQPGLSWSPDGSKVVLAAKAGGGDVFYLIDIMDYSREKLEFDMDGLFTAAWSPDGERIAFVGSVGRSSDIFVYDLKEQELINITNDIFSDSEPAWSPDGEEIAFVSERRSVDNTELVNMAEYDYSQTDIYMVDVATGEISQVTDTDYNENYPLWANTQNTLLYTADYNGIWNLHFYNLDSRDYFPVTNVLTGIYQISLTKDDKTLVYSGYSGMGWDIFSLANPLEMEAVTIEPTNYIKNLESDDESFVDMRVGRESSVSDRHANEDFSRFIFAKEYERINEYAFEGNEPLVELSDDSTKTADGEYITNIYKTRFSLDLVDGQAAFSNVFGYSGSTIFLFSDILGDHQIILGTELVLTLENSDYYFTYAYLKHRIDHYFTAYHMADFFSDGYSYLSRLRNYGASYGQSIPLNRYNRFEFELTASQVRYTIYGIDYGNDQWIPVFEERLNTVLPSASWIYDNTIYGYTGPVDGFRQNLRVVASPKANNDGLSFQTITLDTRHYYRFLRDYSLAGRLMIGTSIGDDAQTFLLGGVPNWLFGIGETNGKDDDGWYRQGILSNSNDNMLKDAYFSVFAMPVRGTRFYERYGTNVALANLEVRFPFINYFALGFPLKMIFGNIRGHVFLDAGAAWNQFAEFSDNELLKKKYDDDYHTGFSPIVAGFGWGVKVNFGYFLLRIDSAWDIMDDGTSRPQFYLSLGPDW